MWEVFPLKSKSRQAFLLEVLANEIKGKKKNRKTSNYHYL